jgi:hypothetical protein
MAEPLFELERERRSASPPPGSISKPSEKNVSGERASLRQEALSGHSFSAPDPRSETRRLRPFLANCPNHEDRLEAHFGPFFASLGSLSPKQPNHGHFGTDVESSIIQRVGGLPKGSGFERIPLGRSEPGSNRLVQFVCFMPQSGPVIRRLRPAGRDPKPKSAHRTSGRVLLVAHHPMPGWSLISARIVRQGRYMVFNDDLLRGSRSVHWAAVEPIAGEFRLENIPVITCGGP